MQKILEAGELAGYPPEIEAALWRLEDTRERTLSLLGNVPGKYLDLETHGNSIGTILYHIALIEADWLYTDLLEQPLPFELGDLFPTGARDQDGILTFIQGQTIDQHLERLSTVRNTLLDTLRGMTIDDFHRMRKLPDYDVSPAWVLHHLSQHEAEHRGELGTGIAFIKSGK